MFDKPEIKFYTWLNAIKTKCLQIKIAPPNALEQKYLTACWKNMNTVSEGIEALTDWRLS